MPSRKQCFVGVDVGSAFSKVVVMLDGEVASHQMVPSGGSYQLAAQEVVQGALARLNLSSDDVIALVATGYGASSVPEARVVSDVTCQAKGAFHLFPSVRTLIDVGDMLTRVIKLDNEGRVVSFLTSGKCAGGSGRVLKVIAHVLQVSLEEMGELSLRAQNPVNFNTGCAVFAETEAVSRVAEGISKEDVLAGLHRALAAQIQSLVERIGLERKCAIVGGGAKDIGLVRRLEEALGLELLVPEEPQIVAALGAALIAREGARQKVGR